MAKDYMGYDTGDVNDEDIPTQSQKAFEDADYNKGGFDDDTYPNSWWKLLALKGIGGTPASRLQRTRPETWREEAFRKVNKAFAKEESARRVEQMHAGAHATLENLIPKIQEWSKGAEIDPHTGKSIPRNPWEHADFGSLWRAQHIIGTPGFESPVDNLHPGVLGTLFNKINLTESPFVAGQKATEEEKASLMHELLSGKISATTIPLREKYMKDPMIKSIVDHFGWDKKNNKYFLRDPGADPYNIDKSKFARNKGGYKLAGKFMTALSSVSNKEIPRPQFREISSNDDIRTKTEKAIFNRQLRSNTAYSVPAIATARVLGGIAGKYVKKMGGTLAGPTLGALAGVIAPTAISWLMHKHADRTAAAEMRHKRFGASPYDLINKGY